MKPGRLAAFVTARLDGPVRAAVAGGGGEQAVAQAVSDVLKAPDMVMRAKAASPQELANLRELLADILNQLASLDALPPMEPWEPYGPRAEHLPGFETVARDFPDLASPDVETRLQAGPEAVHAALTKAAETVIRAADAAGRKTAADAEPPTQRELAAWIGSGDCPPDTLDEVATRLEALWGLDPGKVRVTGWAFGGLTTWRDDEEFHAPAGDLEKASRATGKCGTNPLFPLVRAWLDSRPIDAAPNLRPDRIMPTKLAMVDPSHRRAGRMLKLFSPAAHRRGQMALPGFESADHDGPALPLALYQLGNDNPHRGGSPAAPMALRLFVEAILAAPYDQRDAGQPVALSIPLRDLLARLYPGPRRPRPNEYWPRLMRAVGALDAMDARIPWVDPATGRGGLRRVVSVGDIPRGPGALDDAVRMVVDLPPGSGPGPLVTPSLGAWGARSAPAYTALLNLAYRWFDPGVTRHRARGGHWLQAHKPERYPELSNVDVVAITRPLAARAARRNLAIEGWETLRELEAVGELRIEGRRVLPPAPDAQGK